jgi:hypothetical protein
MADLPPPPRAGSPAAFAALGPGIILLGVAIGSGEWLLGPAAFTRYGASLLWVTTVAVFLQTLFNTEIIRYTMYTGEPITVGFMRTRPGPRFWGAVYGLLYFFQVGWPGWAGAAAGAIFYLFAGRLAGPASSAAVSAIAIGTFLVIVLVLLLGPRIGRTVEILNWVLVSLILGGLALLALVLAPIGQWLGTALGFIGYNAATRTFQFLPEGGDWFLIGAFAAYSAAGGMVNLTLTNWTRDKGWGMGQQVGYIPAAVGGQRARLPHVGSAFRITAESLARWRGWWRIARLDQWGVFLPGALLGMGLPALLYSTFIEPGKDIRGPAIAAELANALATREGTTVGLMVALIGAWVLFSTQLDIVEGMARGVTDLLWAGSRRMRSWRGGDVRAVYYIVLAAVVAWGLLAMQLTQPIILLQLSANMAGLVFVIAGLHTLRLNTTLLPPELRPPLWRRIGLVTLAAFYGVFVYLWLFGGLAPDPNKGFLFNMPRYLGF